MFFQWLLLHVSQTFKLTGGGRAGSRTGRLPSLPASRSPVSSGQNRAGVNRSVQEQLTRPGSQLLLAARSANALSPVAGGYGGYGYPQGAYPL